MTRMYMEGRNEDVAGMVGVGEMIEKRRYYVGLATVWLWQADGYADKDDLVYPSVEAPTMGRRCWVERRGSTLRACLMQALESADLIELTVHGLEQVG